jgi:bifunctional UDP-N-acetylglucosamine pyrophosphorylase/glucosamine-1-phosphate N-acetyltransferase
MEVSAIVLAAGQGSRMKSSYPKVLHEIGGAPLLIHALKCAGALVPEATVVVTGVGAEQVEETACDWDPDIICVWQEEQKGTGHAVLEARDALEGLGGDVIVLYGDTPFIRPETLDAMQDARETHDIVVLGFELDDPEARYGRLITDGEDLIEIVEFKDATPEQRKLTLCNSGVVYADKEILFDLLTRITNDNASGEYYLTDIVAIAQERGHNATVVHAAQSETMGINTRYELAEAEAEFQARSRAEALDDGVTLVAPETVIFAHDTVIGRDAIIEPHVVFGPGVTVESGARIRAFSHLEGCHVGRGAVVGPYARLRPGAQLASDVKIGNFVEVKNAQIDRGTKVNHLSYIGDATIGEKTNIGAGTITCNYDGVFKHHTTIGRDVFVGSNTMLVAPVTLGDHSATASGAVITMDVPEGDLAIARARQENKPGLAKRMFERFRATKAELSKKGGS